jgi:hypothetical protein
MGLFSSTNTVPSPRNSPARKFIVKISRPYPIDSSPLPSPVFHNKQTTKRQASAKSSSFHGAFTSTIFAGNNYWGPASQPLLSLDDAKRKEYIVKRGFEFAHNKAQEYRLSEGFNVGKDGFVRNGDRRVNGSNAAAAAATVSREIHYDFCGDSPAKNLLVRPPLVSLEEANKREKIRRRKAAQEMMSRKLAKERQVLQIEREEAKKKELARREELERVALEARRKEDLQRRQEAAALASAALTTVVSSSVEHLVVGPTNWIVPLISLEDAKKNETTRRQKEAAEVTEQEKAQVNDSSSLNHLIVNTMCGSAELRLVSLDEAGKREKIRRQREEQLEAIKSHERMTARVGVGLTHVPLVTLEEARRRELIRRRKEEQPEVQKTGVFHPPNVYRTHGDIDEGCWRNAAGVQEKMRWHNLMSRTNEWWWNPSGGDSFGFMNSATGTTAYPDWL